MSLKKIACDNNWIGRCCISIDYDKENRKTIYDYTDKAGALFSGSYDIYNKKKQMVDTVYIKEVIISFISRIGTGNQCRSSLSLFLINTGC